jgi:hypothetical protein
VEAIVRDCGITGQPSEAPLDRSDDDEEADGEAFSWSRW